MIDTKQKTENTLDEASACVPSTCYSSDRRCARHATLSAAALAAAAEAAALTAAILCETWRSALGQNLPPSP